MMKQAVMTEPGRIVLREVPIPATGEGQIEVKIKAIGVCGSDIHVWHGKHPYTSYPVVQGHEVAAEVTKVGPGVTGFAPGDAVTIQPQEVCGVCYPCTHGLYNDCEKLKVMGFQCTGMASEYFVTDATRVLPLPEGMGFEQGAMIEPLAVAVHALRRFGPVADKRILVMGGGPIGNLVAQAAKAQGAKAVLLSEVSAYRLQAAAQCGVATVNPREMPVSQAVKEVLGEDGADCILECTGSPACISEAVEIARKGSDIIIVGVVSEPVAINMSYVQDHELRVSGTAMYRTEDYLEAIRLSEAGLINLVALITHRVPFSQYEQAYRIIEEEKDKAMKVMILMEGFSV